MKTSSLHNGILERLVILKLCDGLIICTAKKIKGAVVSNPRPDAFLFKVLYCILKILMLKIFKYYSIIRKSVVQL